MLRMPPIARGRVGSLVGFFLEAWEVLQEPMLQGLKNELNLVSMPTTVATGLISVDVFDSKEMASLSSIGGRLPPFHAIIFSRLL